MRKSTAHTRLTAGLPSSLFGKLVATSARLRQGEAGRDAALQHKTFSYYSLKGRETVRHHA